MPYHKKPTPHVIIAQAKSVLVPILYPRCDVCGCFLGKGEDGTYRCWQVFYDDYTGAWEHA